MPKAKVVRVETIKVQGIKLINVVFVTKNGIEAVARAISSDQFEIGQTYLGKLKYAPCSDIRIFEAKTKVSSTGENMRQINMGLYLYNKGGLNEKQ